MKTRVSYFRKFMQKLPFENNPPEFLEEYPSFLKREYALWTGLCRKKFSGKKGKFRVENNREYDRILSLKGEEELIESIVDNLEKGDVFWDIGCNIGTHAVLAGLKTECKVLGFEPYHKNYDNCTKNFSINSINGKVLPIALYDEEGEKHLTQETGETGEGRNHLSEDGFLEVKTLEGDKLVEEENFDPPNIVKIDVEGAELRVLKGISKLLEKDKIRVIYIELHPDRLERYGDSENKLFNFLEDKGFKKSQLGIRSDEIHLEYTNQRLSNDKRNNTCL